MLRKPLSQQTVSPRKIVIARNVKDPVKRNLRGPVWIYVGMQKLGPAEINFAPEDPNKCSSLVRLADDSLAFAHYTLQDIEGLLPSDVPFLVHVGGGMYRHKTLDELAEEHPELAMYLR